MMWIYEQLMVLWDNLYNRHEKAVKVVVCSLLLGLCVVMAVLEVYKLIK